MKTCGPPMTATVPEFRPSAAHAGLQRRPGRIPEPRFWIVGVRRKVSDVSGQDQPAPAHRVRMAFLRVAPVHDHVGSIKAFLEMSLVRFEMQRRRLNPGRVRKHAIGGGDDIGFDAKRADHAARYSWLSELTSDKNSARVCA